MVGVVTLVPVIARIESKIPIRNNLCTAIPSATLTATYPTPLQTPPLGLDTPR